MNIHETINAVISALDGADRLARLCKDSDRLNQADVQRLVAITAEQLALDVARARAGLNGSASINPE